MATSIGEAFRQFRSNLEITSLQASTVSERQQNVRAAVASELVVQSSFLTGSYMRDTMIAPLSQADVDIFVELHPQYFQYYGGQANILDRVKRALQKYYRASDISRNGRAVTIAFSDFQIDVVPAFQQPYGSGWHIPDSRTATWVLTDPRRHVEIWRRTNSEKGECSYRL
jgi:tRNA nucleotidyltransferase (CCA-adding enzyme)